MGELTVPSSRRRIGIAVLVVTNSSVHLKTKKSQINWASSATFFFGAYLLFLLLFFGFLSEATLAGVCDVEGVVSGGVCAVVAALHDEGVCLAPLNRYFRYQEIVQVPGDAPGWLARDRGVAAFASRGAYLRRKCRFT